MAADLDAARHETAHAVAILVGERDALLRSVSVIPEGDHTGLVRVRRRRDADPRAVAITSLAGLAAENHGRPDWEPTADTFARHMHIQDIRDAYAAVAGFTDPDAEMAGAWRAARRLVTAEWTGLERVAHLLRRRGCMAGAEFASAWRAVRTSIT